MLASLPNETTGGRDDCLDQADGWHGGLGLGRRGVSAAGHVADVDARASAAHPHRQADRCRVREGQSRHQGGSRGDPCRGICHQAADRVRRRIGSGHVQPELHAGRAVLQRPHPRADRLCGDGLWRTRAALTSQYSSGFDGIRFEGKLYGIPTEVSNYACFANNAMWKEAGLDPDKDFPKTWEAMPAVAEKLTKRDANGVPLRRGFDFDWPNRAAFWLHAEHDDAPTRHQPDR